MNNSVTEVVFAFLIAAATTALLSMILLSRYRRAVRRYMFSGTAHPAVQSPAPSSPLRPGPSLIAVDTASGGGSRMRLALLIYAAAGAAYALLATVLVFWLEQDFLPFRAATVFLTFCWPAVLTVMLIRGPDKRFRSRAIAAYLAAMLVLGVAYFLVAPPGESIAAVLAPTFVWIQMGLLPSVFLIPFLRRSVRAVAPLMLAFNLVAIHGTLAFLLRAGQNGDILGSLLDVSVALGMDSVPAFLVLYGGGSLIIFAAAAWLLARQVARLYTAKRITDQSISIDALWLVFALFTAVHVVPTAPALALAPFAAYKLVSFAGLRSLRSRVQRRPNRRLLLLRVFGDRNRCERLFELIGNRWRYEGNIVMIGGEDLAGFNIEPHEILDFLAGKLRQHFIAGPGDLDRLDNGIDPAPDFDGRYRVSEFFCAGDIWRSAVVRLMDASDAVLMDVRGFDRSREGVGYELDALAHRAGNGRLVLLADSSTKMADLEERLAAAWNRAGRSSRDDAVWICHFRKETGETADAILSTLLAAPPAAESTSGAASGGAD